MAQVQNVVEVAEVAEVQKPITGGYTSVSIPKREGNFIVTAVQNNTDTHQEFWQALNHYAELLGAEIICCPILYNKNAFAQPDDVQGEYFSPEFSSHMLKERVILNNNVLVVGNAHILPTASNPLSNFGSICEAGQTVVIPASKIALECLPVLKGQDFRTLISTGTATQKNYIQRKVGVTSELTHRFGACIVQAGKPVRSIYWANGEFFDFDGDNTYRVTAKEYFIDDTADTVLTLGDIHAEKCPVDRLEAIKKIIWRVKPLTLVCHDTLDFSSRNHHHMEDAFTNHAFDVNGDSVKSDVAKARKVVRALRAALPLSADMVLVDSNHDRALALYITRQDFKKDMKNAEFYLKMAYAYVKAINNNLTFNPFAYALKGIIGIKCLNASDSFIRNGSEFAHHGDTCANGARGSLKGFAKLAQNLVIGHSHSPGISGLAYQVGVSGSLQMGYNEKGASGWRHAHCVTFPNGQNQIYFE